MLFPEAEVTRSLSNMIKAYTVRYKEELRTIDIEEREESIQARVDAIQEEKRANAFIEGLQAIALTEDGSISENEGLAEGEEGVLLSGEEVNEAVVRRVMDEEAIEAWKEEERKKLKVELTEAEKLALKIEMEKEIRTQADVILEQARAQGEQLKTKAKLAAEAEKFELLEAAKKEGYEEGKQKLLDEEQVMVAAFAEKERFLEEQYEKKVGELEPKATEVVIRMLEHLTGVCLETRKGIVTYLVTNALSEADRSNTFLIKVSKEDFEEVKGASERLRALFEREVTLEVVQDVLMKKGECMIETDTNIIDCSLGTQLEGLIEDIRLLSVQERV